MISTCLKRFALLVALGLLGNTLTGCYYLGQKGNLYLPDETPRTGQQKSTSSSR